MSLRKRKAKKKNEEKHTSGAEYVPSSGANSESQKCNIERYKLHFSAESNRLATLTV